MTEEKMRGRGTAGYIMRRGLGRTARLLREKKPVNVAFIGGSVTAGAGASDTESTSYRARTCRYMLDRYPEVPIRLYHAAIGGTDSTYGAFRLQEHLFRQGTPDLLFVEFAVNDNGSRTAAIRGMEGIVRQALAHHPGMEIVFLYTASRAGSEEYLRSGMPQANVSHHEEVAERYGIPSVHIAEDIYRRIRNGQLRWEDISGDDVHPNDEGYCLYASVIRAFLEDALQMEAAAASDERGLLPQPIDPWCYAAARLLPHSALKHVAGGRSLPAWSPEKTCNWMPPADVLVLEGTGAGMSFPFEGTAVGLVILAGEETGELEVSVDGSPFTSYPVFDRYCTQFYRPKILMLADGLPPGFHHVSVRIPEERHPESKGHLLHVQGLMVNGR